MWGQGVPSWALGMRKGTYIGGRQVDTKKIEAASIAQFKSLPAPRGKS